MSEIDHKPEFRALERLLDDPSPAVRAALAEEFRRRGEAALTRLRELADTPRNPLSAHAASMLRTLGDADHAAAFMRYIHAGTYDLEEGCLLFERVLNARVAPADFADPMDAMAARARELLAGVSGMRETCRVLNRVIFHEWGFRGDQNVFLSPDGSLLGRVLATRRGIPISLCIIYLLVARRCGVRLDAIGLPGRFMLGHRTDLREGFFIDCYDGGVFRTRGEVKMILLRNGLPATDDFLAPVDTDEILCRCCRNLASQLEASQGSAAGIFLGFVRELEKTFADDELP